jgi:hypothetical protein
LRSRPIALRDAGEAIATTGMNEVVADIVGAA